MSTPTVTVFANEDGTVTTVKEFRADRRGIKSRAFVWTPMSEGVTDRQAIAEMRRVAEAALGAKFAGAKFSRTAGCGCGCSPGFVLQTEVNREFLIQREAM